MSSTAPTRQRIDAAMRDFQLDAPDKPRVWGATPDGLHDLLWASRCVQVVRPGMVGGVISKGPALYLLLEKSQIVHIPLDRVLKRMHWASPRLVRLRINVHDSIDYTEGVADTPLGVRFERSYGRPIRMSERAWLTGDPFLAKLWAVSTNRSTGQAALRSEVSRDHMISLAIDGHSSTSTTDATDTWLEAAQKNWKRPNAVIPGIFEYQPGVWVHESARLDPSVRVHGTAWIGAGIELGPGEIVIGPVVLDDLPAGESDLPTPGVKDVDWELTRSPHWALPSLARGSTFRRAWKRTFDICFSLVVLLFTLPLYIPIMIAIWAEDGRPFFFAHQRQTLGGKDFPCLKFRTMRRDAELIKAELIKANAADGPQFFMENDPRVTRIGRFLRKVQFDELPQFINVLAGHMSVVGPRPSPEKENQFCPAWREARLSIRPGVTGLWQVSRTREPQTDFQEWIRYDLEYVQHQSFVGDLRIIFETVRHIIA